MPGILKTETTTKRITYRLTTKQQEFKNAHPKLNFSEIMRQSFDRFIKNFDEEEYRRMTK